ncbi:MAG: pterin-4-alpha-carbinolamine dehydratase [Flavobacteriaceae bacterium]|nr:pterin-4-alpha-carbinolamine dehydratase [Flavobacteriaceae bacterium]|tara:strand:+ start:53642 stop:53878 length:237 start_codon:yes stop_codon:yes gene_type:complete
MKSWKTENNKLVKEFVFKDFNEAVSFINKVAKESEILNHHPTIINTYNKVSFELWTHSENKVTALDHELKNRIDALFK